MVTQYFSICLEDPKHHAWSVNSIEQISHLQAPRSKVGYTKHVHFLSSVYSLASCVGIQASLY